jgi:uncharacterized protein YjbI with pentapeptide repeats
MDKVEIHQRYLDGKSNGEKANFLGADLQGANLLGADLQGANLQGADLQGADLRWANLQGANLQGANLQGADLQEASLRWADLRGADLQGADLQGANIDFSCLPLHCGSFNVIVDDSILEQLLTHIKKLNIKNCSSANKKIVESIPKRVGAKLKERHGVMIR